MSFVSPERALSRATQLAAAALAAAAIAVGGASGPAGAGTEDEDSAVDAKALAGFEVVGFADGAIAVSIEESQLNLGLTIVADRAIDDARARVSDLRIAGTAVQAGVTVALTDPDGVEKGRCPSTNEVCVGPVAAQGAFELNLDAELPRPGVFAGLLTVVNGEQPVRFPITVTYAPALPTVEVDPVAAVHGNEVSVTVRETGGRTVQLALPELVGMARVDDDDVSVGITVEDVDIDVLRPNAASGSAPDPIELRPNQTVRLEVEIEDLPSHGKFTGKLRFSKTGSEEAVEATLEFLRRRPWWIAMIVALLGAILGEVLRRLVMPGIKRTTAQLEVARGVDTFAAIERQLAERAEHQTVRRVIGELRLRLRLLGAAARVGAIDATKAKSDIEALVERARRLGWFADAVKAAEAAGVIDDARADIRIVERFIVDSEGEDAAVQLALGRVEDRAVAGLTEAEVAMFGAEIAEAALKHPVRLKSAIDAANTTISLVEAAFAANEFRVGAMRYTTGRKDWALALGLDVEARIAARPVYVSAAAWEQLKAWKEQQPIDDVFRWIDPFARQSGTLVERSLRTWLAAHLLPTDASEEDRAKRAVLVGAADTLQRSLAGPPLRILAAIDDVTTAYLAVQPPPQGASPPASVPAGFAPSWVPRPIAGAVEVDSDELAVPTSIGLQSRLNQLEGFVSGLAILLAVASAILLIWSTNKTWGSLQEVGFLFLWALGIHQITGVSGTAVIRSQLVGGGAETGEIAGGGDV